MLTLLRSHQRLLLYEESLSDVTMKLSGKLTLSNGHDVLSVELRNNCNLSLIISFYGVRKLEHRVCPLIYGYQYIRYRVCLETLS